MLTALAGFKGKRFLESFPPPRPEAIGEGGFDFRMLAMALIPSRTILLKSLTDEALAQKSSQQNYWLVLQDGSRVLPMIGGAGGEA